MGEGGLATTSRVPPFAPGARIEHTLKTHKSGLSAYPAWLYNGRPRTRKTLDGRFQV